MTLRYSTISFLSDYGHQDEFVGVVHSVLHQLCPEVRVIDINHNVPPFDIRSGGLTLARASQYMAPGVVLAVVDPGVGSPRRGVAVEVGDGQAVFVGPDNGVLAPAVAMVGGATRAVELNKSEYHLEAPGPLFAGRDIFAPVAARLCEGIPLEEVGTLIDPVSLLPGIFPISDIKDGEIHGEVLWVDRYGNAQLNIDPESVAALGDVVEIEVDGRTRSATIVHHFTELGPGAIGIATDSYGFASLVTVQGSAAEELRAYHSTGVIIRPISDDQESSNVGITTTVTLGERPKTSGSDAGSTTKQPNNAESVDPSGKVEP